MTPKSLMYIAFIFTNTILIVHGKQRKERDIYPLRSLLGLFVAIAVPVDIPENSVFVSYNFEGNYYLPANTSELGDMLLISPITTIREGRGLNRMITYKILEDRFKQEGLPERMCMLRCICEAADTPLAHNGVLGGIMHVLFTPSASADEALPLSFYIAERRGHQGDCEVYTRQCTSGLFDLISKVVNEPDNLQSF